MKAIAVDPKDNVATLTDDAAPGTDVVFRLGAEQRALTAEDRIPFGHKVAIEAIGAGDPVVKYGEHIGLARCPIELGRHVHLHNVRSLRGQVETFEEPSQEGIEP